VANPYVLNLEVIREKATVGVPQLVNRLRSQKSEVRR